MRISVLNIGSSLFIRLVLQSSNDIQVATTYFVQIQATMSVQLFLQNSSLLLFIHAILGFNIGNILFVLFLFFFFSCNILCDSIDIRLLKWFAQLYGESLRKIVWQRVFRTWMRRPRARDSQNSVKRALRRTCSARMTSSKNALQSELRMQTKIC